MVKKLGLKASGNGMDSSRDALGLQMMRLSNTEDPLFHRQQEVMSGCVLGRTTASEMSVS